MTRREAIHVVCSREGGRVIGDGDSTLYRFPSLEAADRAKAVLDALLPPGHTGKVVGPGMLYVAVPS